MKDKIVIDIETKNTFADVGGREYIEKLDASLVGVYSYNTNAYTAFRDGEWDKLAPLLQNAHLIVGFSISRFDLPVLKKYFPFNVMALPRLDLLDEIEATYGSRVSLDILARANLGTHKTSHGLEAVEMYQRGEWQKLAEYCLHDVKITKELYEFVRKNGYVNIPKRFSEEIVKVPLAIKEIELPATLF